MTTRFRVFKGRPGWRTTDPTRPWVLLGHHQGGGELSGLGIFATWGEAMAAAAVAACREAYAALLSHGGDADAAEVHRLRSHLFDALTRQLQVRLAAAGTGPLAVTVPELYVLGLPCADCLQVIDTWNGGRHEIVLDGSRVPYARCGR